MNFHMRSFILGPTFPKDQNDSFPKIICVADLYGVNERQNLAEHWPNGRNLLKEYIGEENGAFNFKPSEVTANNAGTPYDLCARDGVTFSLPPILLVTGDNDPLKGCTFIFEEILKSTISMLQSKFMKENVMDSSVFIGERMQKRSTRT